MPNKNSNKISIKPMNNAAAIASTLGITASFAPKDEQTARKTNDTKDGSQMIVDADKSAAKSPAKSAKSGKEIQTANEKVSAAGRNREVAATTSKPAPRVSQATTNSW